MSLAKIGRRLQWQLVNFSVFYLTLSANHGLLYLLLGCNILPLTNTKADVLDPKICGFFGEMFGSFSEMI
jgi:hypothetical protein